MTDDACIARLTELARKVWPGVVQVRLRAFADEGMQLSVETAEWHRTVLSIIHPRALDALEAALRAVAGEPPLWVVELAEKWQQTADNLRGPTLQIKIQADTLVCCADELLAAAKGGKP
jgi:hypothetical protein